MRSSKQAKPRPAAEADRLKRRAARLQKREQELVAASRALQQSEEWFRELVSKLPDGVLVYRQGRIVYANPYVLSVSGYTQDELLGRPVLDLVHPDDRDMVAANMAGRLDNREAVDRYELRIAARSGQYHSVVVQAENILYGGEPAVLTVLIDITEKRRSERIQDAVYRIAEAVHISDDLPELYRSIHQTISGLMYAGNFYIALFDPESGLLSFPYFIDEFDIPPGSRGLEKGLTEYVLRSGSPLLATPEILASLERQGEIQLIGAPSIDWLGVPLKIKGNTIGVLVAQTYSQGMRYGQEEKNILMFVSDQVAMAIERKRTEFELRRSEQKNRAILSAIPDLMFLLGKDGVFLDYKAEKDSDLLARPEMFLGRKVGEVLPPALAELTMKTIAQVLQTRRVQVFEYEVEINGMLQYEEARCALCGSDEVLVAIRNITENRRLERQVLQAQKMESLGTLAGGIAHDFNNILAGILGYASFIKSQLDPGHDHYKYVDTIERSASRAADLTSKLLSFTRGDKVNFKPLNINRLVGEILEIICHTFDRAIQVETVLDSSLPTIEGDAGQIQQVLMNLCVNARDALAGGGRLSIATAVSDIGAGDLQAPAWIKPGAYVQLSVRDSGSGMNRDVQARIFDPFFTTKAKGQGSGLGLSVVYGIVKGHEGFITVDSHPGRGTVFHVFLPASGRPETLEKDLVDPPRGHGELVLAVDDEEDIRNFIQDVLQSHGYRVLSAADGGQALAIYTEHWREIALVILDLVMPGMGGEDVFLKMKTIHPGIKALLSTGYNQDGRAGKIIDQGISGFIQKPYDFTRLLILLRRVLDGSG